MTYYLQFDSLPDFKCPVLKACEPVLEPAYLLWQMILLSIGPCHSIPAVSKEIELLPSVTKTCELARRIVYTKAPPHAIETAKAARLREHGINFMERILSAEQRIDPSETMCEVWISEKEDCVLKEITWGERTMVDLWKCLHIPGEGATGLCPVRPFSLKTSAYTRFSEEYSFPPEAFPVDNYKKSPVVTAAMSRVSKGWELMRQHLQAKVTDGYVIQVLDPKLEEILRSYTWQISGVDVSYRELRNFLLVNNDLSVITCKAKQSNKYKPVNRYRLQEWQRSNWEYIPRSVLFNGKTDATVFIKPFIRGMIIYHVFQSKPLLGEAITSRLTEQSHLDAVKMLLIGMVDLHGCNLAVQQTFDESTRDWLYSCSYKIQQADTSYKTYNYDTLLEKYLLGDMNSDSQVLIEDIPKKISDFSRLHNALEAPWHLVFFDYDAILPEGNALVSFKTDTGAHFILPFRTAFFQTEWAMAPLSSRNMALLEKFVSDEFSMENTLEMFFSKSSDPIVAALSHDVMTIISEILTEQKCSYSYWNFLNDHDSTGAIWDTFYKQAIALLPWACIQESLVDADLWNTLQVTDIRNVAMLAVALKRSKLTQEGFLELNPQFDEIPLARNSRVGVRMGKKIVEHTLDCDMCVGSFSRFHDVPSWDVLMDNPHLISGNIRVRLCYDLDDARSEPVRKRIIRKVFPRVTDLQKQAFFQRFDRLREFIGLTRRLNEIDSLDLSDEEKFTMAADSMQSFACVTPHFHELLSLTLEPIEEDRPTFFKNLYAQLRFVMQPSLFSLSKAIYPYFEDVWRLKNLFYSSVTVAALSLGDHTRPIDLYIKKVPNDPLYKEYEDSLMRIKELLRPENAAKLPFIGHFR